PKNNDHRKSRHGRQPASDSESVHGRAGHTLRPVRERADAIWQGVHRSESERDAGPDRGGADRAAVPLSRAYANGQGSDAVPAGGEGMKTVTPLERSEFSRRGFLKGAGALIVGFSMKLDAQTAAVAKTTALEQVDSWIVVSEDETVTGYVGKCDFGQGF